MLHYVNEFYLNILLKLYSTLMNLKSVYIQNNQFLILIFMKEYVTVTLSDESTNDNECGRSTFGIYLERDYRLGLSMGVPGDDAVGAGEVELDLRDL